MRRGSGDSGKSPWSGAGEVSSLAMTFALAVLIGSFGGNWIGGKLGHEDAGLLIGLAFGTVAAILELYRTAQRMGGKQAKKPHPDDDDG